MVFGVGIEKPYPTRDLVGYIVSIVIVPSVIAGLVPAIQSCLATKLDTPDEPGNDTPCILRGLAQRKGRAPQYEVVVK